MRLKLLSLALLAFSVSGSTQQPTRIELAWVNDQEWVVSGNKSFVPYRTPGLPKAYIIAPVFAAMPQSKADAGIGPHDFVMSGDTPGGRMMLIEPGPRATGSNT